MYKIIADIQVTMQTLVTKYKDGQAKILNKKHSICIPNTEAKRNADPNPRASPIAFVSGVCIR